MATETPSATTTTETTPTTTTAATTPTTNSADELVAIKKQVEFYFSDSNLPRDKFLRAQIILNSEGFVPISVLLTFKRMQKYTLENVVEALASSTLVQLNSDKTGVKRRSQDDLVEDTSIPRTIYVKGWPLQTTLEDVEKFFAPYGTVLSVRFRRYDNKNKVFKGSLFVEFATEEEAQSVLNIKPQPPISEINVDTKPAPKEGEPGPSEPAPAVGKRHLLYLTKTEWVQEKHEQLQKQRTENNKRKHEDNEDKKNKKKKKTLEKLEEEKKEKEVKRDPSGSIVKFSNIPPGLTRFILKPIFEAFGLVRHIDYANDASDGYIRYVTPQVPLDMIKDFTEKKTQINGQTPVFHILPPDEEAEYWGQLQAKLPKDVKKKKKVGGKMKYKGKNKGKGRN